MKIVFFLPFVLALLLSLVNLLLWLGSPVDSASNATRSVAAVSFDHDGHRWVRGGGDHGGLAHHPDCPCRATAEKEDK
jgi:hypothetical protein